MTTGINSSTASAKGVKSAKIQPSAIFSIFDQFQRRSELCTGRLIGAIFGTREEESEGLITVSQAFPIPHSEINDQVREYYQSVFNKHIFRLILIVNIIKIVLNY